MTGIQVTHIGGPTALIEVDGWRLLTDPTFDPPGRKYSFGWGASSRKLHGPAIPAGDIGPIDAVLLSHDHHGDNLDDAGRAFLPRAKQVLTTVSGAKRLRGNAYGLAAGSATVLERPGHPAIKITATPCRHGPPLSHPIAGDVIGFVLSWDSQQHGALWITGDTVLYNEVRQVPQQTKIGTMLLHLGCVQFPVTGPARYTMTAAQAVELCSLAQPHTTMPVHYEGWNHFHESRDAVQAAFALAPDSVRASLTWLPLGARSLIRT